MANHKNYVIERFLGFVSDYQDSPLGDYVCLNFKDNKEEPGVCVWSNSESEEFHPVTYKVTDSFLYFAESLE